MKVNIRLGAIASPLPLKPKSWKAEKLRENKVITSYLEFKLGNILYDADFLFIVCEVVHHFISCNQL